MITVDLHITIDEEEEKSENILYGELQISIESIP